MRPMWQMVQDPSYDPFQGAYGKKLREMYGHAWDAQTDNIGRGLIHMLITGRRDRLIKQGKLNPSVAER
jgi:hypothetical protein